VKNPRAIILSPSLAEQCDMLSTEMPVPIPYITPLQIPTEYNVMKPIYKPIIVNLSSFQHRQSLSITTTIYASVARSNIRMGSKCIVSIMFACDEMTYTY
jgi:hypothetical protein